MNDLDKQLNAAYERSKQNHIPPAKIKRQVMQEAERQESGYLPFWFNREWAAMGAAGFVLAILVGLFDFTDQVMTYHAPSDSLVALEVHAYQEEHFGVNAQQYREQLTAYQADFEQSLALQKVASTRVVRLEQTEGRWVMSDCDNHQIAISDRLLADLKADQRVETGLSVGDQVELALNREGFILQINNAQQPMQC